MAPFIEDLMDPAPRDERASSRIDTASQLERINTASHAVQNPMQKSEDDVLAGWLDCLTVEVKHHDSGQQSFYRASSSTRFFFALAPDGGGDAGGAGGADGAGGAGDAMSLRTFADAAMTEEHGSVRITTDSTAFETTLDRFAFQLVTPFAVIHLRAADHAARARWLAALQAAIGASRLPPVLTAEAVRLAQEDVGEFYEVLYATHRPLGMALTRQPFGEWAEVSQASPTAGMFVGSFVHAVDGRVVAGLPYQTVVERLRRWKVPPLLLQFRCAPSFSGVLLKRHRLDGPGGGAEARGAAPHAGNTYAWVSVPLRLLDARTLKYGSVRPGAGAGAAGAPALPRVGSLKGVFSSLGLGGGRRGTGTGAGARGSFAQRLGSRLGLGMGTVVELGKEEAAADDGAEAECVFMLRGGCVRTVTAAEAGVEHAFVLLNGTERLVLAAPDAAARDRWCAHLYYAFAIANGGGFLLEQVAAAGAGGGSDQLSSKEWDRGRDEDRVQAQAPRPPTPPLPAIESSSDSSATSAAAATGASVRAGRAGSMSDDI
eukprot:g4680.t1